MENTSPYPLPKLNKKPTYWQLIPYIRPEIPTIAIAFTCTLIFIGCWPIIAWLAGDMARYIGEGNLGAIAQIAGICFFLFLFRGAAQYGQDSLMAKAALKIALEIRKQIYAHLQKLSLNYFQAAKTGDLSYRLTEDIDRIGEVINKFFHDFIPCVLQLVVMLTYMVYLNWQLTVAVFIVAPLIALSVAAFGEQILKLSRRAQQNISNLSSLVIEIFSGIRLVQAFAAEEYEMQRFSQEAENNRRAKYLTEQLKAFQYFVNGFLQAMGIVFLLFLGGWQISKNNLTGTEFISYVAAVAILIDPIAHITSNYNEFKQGQASIDRIFELFNLKPLVVENPRAIVMPTVSGRVEYRNVSFAYHSDRFVLKNLNFVANPGETIALVGASGGGKSTLLNLLPRFYDPQTGSIFIDGINICEVTLQSLRRQIGIVPQEDILFSGTIAENIGFGQINLDLDAIEAAAKIANAHGFISQLSQGYYTYVGERGVNLSGGQRQRIAIARAVLFDPQILILDEATSALDSESESEVAEALERVMKKRTVFIIAHRLATIRRVDRIFVLEAGQIVESGTHEQLLIENGRYAGFHARQFQ
ncbi:MAG: ABC transporter ATP-binding protein [Prochloraceae cyanobacterium]